MDDQPVLCLKWDNYQSTHLGNLSALLESGTLVDCTLAAEGKYLKAHKVVLSACSPYFENLLNQHHDLKHPVIILMDVKFCELKAIIDYMYRGRINIPQDQFASLLESALTLQIKGLSDCRIHSRIETITKKTDNRTSSIKFTSVDITNSSKKIKKEVYGVYQEPIPVIDISGDESSNPELLKEKSLSPVNKKMKRESLDMDDLIQDEKNYTASKLTDTPVIVSVTGSSAVFDAETQAGSSEEVDWAALQLTKDSINQMLQFPQDDLITPSFQGWVLLKPEDNEESVVDLVDSDDDMNDFHGTEENITAGPSQDPVQTLDRTGNGAQADSGNAVRRKKILPSEIEKIQEVAQALKFVQTRKFDISKTLYGYFPYRNYEKPWFCAKCDKNYQQKGSLIRHLSFECGLEPRFRCPYCEYKTKQKTNFFRHIYNVHGDQLTDRNGGSNP